MEKDVETTTLYMNMPIQLKARLVLIAQNSRPRRDLTGLINYVMSLYADFILSPLAGLDDMLEQIRIRADTFSMEEIFDGTQGDMPAEDAGH